MADKKTLKYSAAEIDALLDKTNNFTNEVKAVVDKTYIESLIDDGDNTSY